jgi:hypothetical protein
MKASAIARIILFSIAILVVGGILIGGLLLYTFAANTDWSKISQFTDSLISVKDGTVTSHGEADPAAVRNLEIDWTSGSVTIIRDQVSQITFSETPGLDDDQKMVWKMKGDTLQINYSKFQLIVGISKSKDLVITVPMDWTLNELEINTVSADITVNDLTAREVDICAVDGNCKFTGSSQVEKMEIETVNGDVSFSGSLDKLKYEAVDADFRAAFTKAPSSLEMGSVNGNFDLKLPHHTGFTAVMNTVSGTFTSVFNTIQNGNRYVAGDGSTYIEIDNVSGNLIINYLE